MLFQSIFIVFIFLAFICVFICAVQIGSLTEHIQNSPNDLIRYEISPIFYANNHERDEVGNKYDCNLRSLKLCNLDDPITVMGCKEFHVRCHHFEKDITYIENGDVSLTIPKNGTLREGYVLSIKDLTTSCNPFHGDLVLINRGIHTNEYSLICNCKFPGYIGNDTLSGSCETIHICNGKVADINKSIDQIQCLCEQSEISKRIHESMVPVCLPLTVQEANGKYEDWSSLVQWGKLETIPTESLNVVYRNNLPNRILNLCRYSILEPTKNIIPNAFYDKNEGTCRFNNYGIPLSIGLFQTETNKDNNTTILDCALHTRLPYEFIRLTTNNALAINVDGKTISVMKNVTLGESCQIMITTKPKVFYAPVCKAMKLQLTYSCNIGNHYDLLENGLPRALQKAHPAFYLWGYESWDKCENVSGKNSLKYTKNGIHLDLDEFLSLGESLLAYGILFGRKESGILSFSNIKDYKIHTEASLP